jgi:hypothetical protein
MSNLPHNPFNFNPPSKTDFSFADVGDFTATDTLNLGKIEESFKLCHLDEFNSNSNIFSPTEILFPKQNIDNILEQADIKLLIKLESIIIDISMPIYYIKNNILPILIIKTELLTSDLLSTRIKYEISINRTKYQVLHYKLVIPEGYILFIPVYIIDVNQSVMIKVISKIHNLYFNEEIYELYVQNLIINNQCFEFYPIYFCKKRPYPIQIYIYAIILYLTTDKSQREVAKDTKKEFNLYKFNHATLCRILKRVFIKLQEAAGKDDTEYYKLTKEIKNEKNAYIKKIMAKEKYKYIFNTFFTSLVIIKIFNWYSNIIYRIFINNLIPNIKNYFFGHAPLNFVIIPP